MNKKGFTLIELLAVIVILAIIALIATPIVLNIIEDSKESSKLNSANHYVDAVEQAIMKENMSNGGNFIPRECEVQSDGNLKCDGKHIIVEVDGEKPTLGIIKFESEKIVDIELDYDGKVIVKNGEGNFVEGFKKYTNGQVVYFNVTTGKGCIKSEYAESQSITGVKEGCMKFYTFNDSAGSETVNLLLDHNITAEVAWNSGGTTILGPGEVLTALYNDTKDWKGTITPEDYTMDQSSQPSTANYIVEYSKIPNIEGATTPYKARLITAQEIAQITEEDVKSNWNEKTSSNFISLADYNWLYDRTSVNCIEFGCPNNSNIDSISPGYWTISSEAIRDDSVWSVYYFSTMIRGAEALFPSLHEKNGVRPVIEVLKSNLS